ncbi:hypothetical protein N1496_00820 [Streptococcus didelphis]|uniref:Uncharacterized protein n=1 Tax=Streptococcus didelphis TaxID=102886 RepID=A0ABY9LJI6_9STRE|nr:hypothetical protein [Streptococcus didelphis]WMB28271.1 hypothetical protein N1496_00820 [Streptococcus didelphis]
MKKLMILLISLVTCCALGVTSPVFAKEDTVTIENNFMARTGKESNSEKKLFLKPLKSKKS